MLVIKEKGKPKQGRIQSGFVKGGGVVQPRPQGFSLGCGWW